jgi:uroporphyrinogen decarboxylase
LRPFDPRDRLDFVFETIRLLRGRLDVPVIGFVGAPFTLMTYMVESPRSKDREGTKAFMWREPSLWEELMTYWADHLLAFALAQAEAGASAIQLFDSWAGALSPADYESCVLPHSRRILAGLKAANVPSIHFATGNPALLPLLARAGGDGIGLDWRVDISDARALLGPERAVQGNLDPAKLLAGSDVAVSETDRILRKVKGEPGHIFNVGHGILPSTDPAVIRAVVDHVHSVDLEVLRSAADSGAEWEGPR